MSMFTVTVLPWERALERRPDSATRVLSPGTHVRRPRATYQHVDVRERLDQTAVQEVPTADGLTVKVTAVVRWRVGDPVRFTEASVEPHAAVYLAVQVALRDALAQAEAEAVVRSVRTEVAARANAAAVAAGELVGVEVLEVVVKDVLLPVELRSAYLELAAGRHRAQLRLEQARAETAALRSMANAAKLLDDHPGLARQRLVESLPPGSTVRLREERG